MAGLFAKAGKLEKPKTPRAKKERDEVPMAQLQSLCEIKALIQSLTATAATLETEIKDAGFEHFMELETNTRPESFRGTDGLASASIEMRKRSTNSPLNEDEVKVLEAHKVTPHKQVITTGLFAINPAYAADQTLLAKVEKALAKVVPEDFIVQQEEVAKLVVTDEMLDAAFKRRAAEPKVARVLIELMTVMAIKPKLAAEYPMEKLIDNVKAIVQPELPKAAAAGAKAA